ncbi:hypothetical protein [Actinomadura rugatobispora]|uniref:DUF2029 domain-containing protein n=1 Tax=Actinomadura rugatobispora TaxID=1994 RepID=A0ABW1A354_9ACTN
MGAGMVLLCAGMAAGPSGLVPERGSEGPFLSGSLGLSRTTVTWLGRTAIGCAAAGTLAVLWALRRGWKGLPPRVILTFGAAAAALMTVLPVAGSVDILNYAVYGRITDLGHNPYTMTPQHLYRLGDPVGLLRPEPWAGHPTVYGPAATAVHALAGHLGGASMAWIVLWLKLFHAAAFTATAYMLHRLTGPDRAARTRAALLWTLNPVMLFWMIGSGHADALAITFLVGAVLVVGNRAALGPALLAGSLAGAAVAVKATFALPVLGLAIAGLRHPRLLATGALGGAVTLATGYLVAGPAAIASLTRRLAHDNDLFLPVPGALLERPALYTPAIAATTGGLALLIWWRLNRRSPLVPEAVLDARPIAAFAVACVVLSPVQYPWYDAAFLPLLALVRPSRLDELLIVRGALLTAIVLPGIGIATPQYEAARVVVLLFTLVLVASCLWRPRTPASLDQRWAPT